MVGNEWKSLKDLIKKIDHVDNEILSGRCADGIGNTIGAIFLLKNLHGYTDEKRVIHENTLTIESTDDIRLALGVNS